jgi:DNA invertase Pin-like site-specific DNA recombinase
MRVAIYTRVSTTDQKVEPQLDQLRAYVTARGWTLVGEFTDHGVSGTRERRPGLDGLMAAARRREIDGVVVAAFDRFARSVGHLLRALAEFEALGVQFVSLREQTDTSTALGRALFVIVGAVAELEHSLIQERARAGIVAAKKRGIRFGRPPQSFNVAEALCLLRSGKSQRAAAHKLGVSARTLARGLEAYNAASGPDSPEVGVGSLPDGTPAAKLGSPDGPADDERRCEKSKKQAASNPRYSPQSELTLRPIGDFVPKPVDVTVRPIGDFVPALPGVATHPAAPGTSAVAGSSDPKPSGIVDRGGQQ